LLYFDRFRHAPSSNHVVLAYCAPVLAGTPDVEPYGTVACITIALEYSADLPTAQPTFHWPSHLQRRCHQRLRLPFLIAHLNTLLDSLPTCISTGRTDNQHQPFLFRHRHSHILYLFYHIH
jgi:hypothetical protein